MSMSLLIPKSELTLTDEKAVRLSAIEAGVKRAITLRIAPDQDGLDVRQFENIFDAGAALEQWNTAALVAVGTAYSVFQAVAAPTLAVNKLAVFYKVAVETIPPPVSLLTVRDGGALGNIRYEYDLEQLYCDQEMVGYFSEPVVIDPQRQFAIQATARIATGVLARVLLGAYIIEPRGQRLSNA